VPLRQLWDRARFRLERRIKLLSGLRDILLHRVKEQDALHLNQWSQFRGPL
jgi:hypothetical protein